MNKKEIIFGLGAFLLGYGNLLSEEIKVNNIEYRGPVEVVIPWLTDSVDVNNKSFNEISLLEAPTNFNLLPAIEGDTLMVLGDQVSQIHFISFPLQNERFADINLSVQGVKDYKVFLDNIEAKTNLSLTPGTREVGIKFMTQGGKKDTIRISVSSPMAQYINTNKWENGRAFTLDDVIYSEHFNNVKVSPSGKYAIVASSQTNKNDRGNKRSQKLIQLHDGKTISYLPFDGEWMENEDKIWFTKMEPIGTRSIMTLNPVTLKESVFAENIPEGRFILSPDNNYLIYFTSKEGPKEDKRIYRILNPEDRQDGYRNRSGLAHYDLKTGIFHDLNFGHKNLWLQDISKDGKKLLVMESHNRFEKRPTSIFSLYEVSLDNLKVDTLVFEDGFISGAKYSPDHKTIAISGTPESLNGIGKNVPEGRIPSMTDGQLFIMNLITREINPITKYFNPSVGDFKWHNHSGNLYFTAEDKDRKSLFQVDPKNFKISKLDVPEDIVSNFSLANNSNNGAVIGESVRNPDVLYGMEYKNGKPIFNKIEGKGEKILSEVSLAEVVDWDFVNLKGDTINGRFYLPPNFDSGKKYPLIVNYYGGCSPTSKNFATRYPHHVYANNGYVVYVINPSGATGFGQEFSSRHVNTAGQGVAEDIIEGTKKFIEEHPFINKDKIGCIGASYGGFMTQYLQTVTDLFAAAISHAGISDHTSYWGNGYWGYSYSEVSMADSYPWSNPDLYVKQSPLYNADKINTPILFLHGDADTNVPPAESIQLFTALKLLGKDTALVEVADQNHHILDPEKRQKWQDTIFAWFAKYLQDDPTWWNNLYPPTSLE